MDNLISCSWCGAQMPRERLEVGYDQCSRCTGQNSKIAFMSYGHKTAPELILVDAKATEQVRQARNAYIRKR